MKEPQAYVFRTAVGGFHKGDVSAYIEKLTAEHQAQLDQLQQALTERDTALEPLREELAAAKEENESLRLQIEALERENARLSADPEPTEELPEESLPEPEETTPDIAPPESQPDPTLQERELAAYRRAEAAERVAYGRARKLYGDMQTICDRSAGCVDASQAAAQNAMNAIDAQLEIIRSAVTGLHQELKTSSEELRAMGQMVPDPAEGMEAD